MWEDDWAEGVKPVSSLSPRFPGQWLPKAAASLSQFQTPSSPANAPQPDLWSQPSRAASSQALGCWAMCHPTPPGPRVPFHPALGERDPDDVCRVFDGMVGPRDSSCHPELLLTTRSLRSATATTARVPQPQQPLWAPHPVSQTLFVQGCPSSPRPTSSHVIPSAMPSVHYWVPQVCLWLTSSP